MTGREAFDTVIEGLKKHARKGTGTGPTKITLGWELAIDLCKLTRDQIGDLAQETFIHGEKALEENGLFGLEVVIDRSTFDSSVSVE